MIILDTNVISALMRQTPDETVIKWLDEQPRTSIWTTSITILEIRFGLQITAAGKRKSALVKSFENMLGIMGERIVSFDAAAAQEVADLMAVRHKKGNPGDLRDSMIGGIVLSQRAALATRNTRHFDDISIPLINPWIA